MDPASTADCAGGAALAYAGLTHPTPPPTPDPRPPTSVRRPPSAVPRPPTPDPRFVYTGAMLPREEYIEQAYFFRVLRERMQQNNSTQELLGSIREEILATTKLPMALEFLEGELKLTGGFAGAMQRIGHYFTTFQTFVMQEAEKDTGRFDFRIALEVLQREAEYRAAGGSIQGTFLYQFETLCRNRLGYDRGLTAMAGQPDLRRPLAEVAQAGDSPPDRPDRHRRPDLRPQPLLPPASRRARGGPVWREEGGSPWPTAARSPLSFLRPGPPPRLSLRTPANQGRGDRASPLLPAPANRAAGDAVAAVGRRGPRGKQLEPILCQREGEEGVGREGGTC